MLIPKLRDSGPLRSKQGGLHCSVLALAYHALYVRASGFIINKYPDGRGGEGRGRIKFNNDFMRSMIWTTEFLTLCGS
jgi:hypothetical protein